MKQIPVFIIGTIVYLKTDEEQRERIVTGFTIRENSTVYLLTQGTEETEHYGFEIATERDMNKVLNIPVER